MSKFSFPIALIAAVGLGSLAFAQNSTLNTTDIPVGTVDETEGLNAWARMYEVFTHPRCQNCHVGDDNVPLWQTNNAAMARAHGMNINAGDSRIGAEYLQCQTCHQKSDLPNVVPHAAPRTNMDWRLAPVEMAWVGKTPAQICAQVRNPETNGGRDANGLVAHITHDAAVGGFITWGFTPGANREAAPGSLQTHLDDTLLWIAAGMPCPDPS